MKKVIIVLFILTASIITNSCRQDQYIPNVCFQENILPIFITKCSMPGCHNANGNGTGRNLSNFTTYEGIMERVTANHALRSDVYTKIRGNNPSMPPKSSPQLTKQEVEYIQYWINFGARNSSCGTTSTCDTLSYITFANSIKKIMFDNCGNSCHSTNLAQSGVILDTYAGVVAGVKGQLLILDLKKLPVTDPTHMPQGYSLTSCEISKVEKWIALGMPE